MGTIAMLTCFFRVISVIRCPNYSQYKQIALKQALIGHY
jgi:hypothetical protein